MRLLAGRKSIARLGMIELAEGDRFARLRGAAFLDMRTEQFENAGHAPGLALRRIESRAVTSLAAQHPHHGHFAAVGSMERLHHHRDRVAALLHAEPPGGFGYAR